MAKKKDKPIWDEKAPEKPLFDDTVSDAISNFVQQGEDQQQKMVQLVAGRKSLIMRYAYPMLIKAIEAGRLNPTHSAELNRESLANIIDHAALLTVLTAERAILDLQQFMATGEVAGQTHFDVAGDENGDEPEA